MSQQDTPLQPVGQDVPLFPCQAFPADTRHARLLGVYPQRQSGRFMQRVRIPGGILSPAQWKALAAIALRFTRATPLHLTTRQDIELHDLAAEDVGPVQEAMAAAGLTALGSGGDTLRNIVVCPCSAGGTSDTPDLLHLAHAIAHVLGEYERLFALPRKFKISLSCPDACARPFSHDLGFVAQRRDDQWGLKVIGAGSLGAKPQTGIVLFDWLAPGEAPALALAAVKLFERLGDRQNRGKARLRHVRQRLGDDAFLRQLQQEFDVASQDRQWPAVTLRCPPEACEAKRPLAFANGDVSPAAADALAELAGTSGLSVRIGNDHRVMLFSRDASAAQQELHKHPALATAGRAQPNVIACPGTRWCARALADTNALAGRIRALLADRPEAGGLIAISGCPNGCVFSGIADIGIIGGKSTVDGHVAEKYTLSTGGGQGRDAALARVVVTGLSAEEVCEKVLAVVSA